MSERDDQLAQDYERNVGHPPRNIHATDPDWLYRGTPKEREDLRERIESEEAEVIDGQESLFS
jgi:hypothetical protein